MNEMYHITASRKKIKYGFFSNLACYISYFWEWNRFLCVAQFLCFIPEILQSLLTNLLPSKLVQGLSDQNSLTEILMMLFAITAGVLICAIINAVFVNSIDVNFDYFSLYFTKKFTSKIREIDYETLEDTSFREVYDNAWNSAMYGRGFSTGTPFISTVISAGVGLLIYGGMIAYQSVILLLLVVLSVGVSLFLLGVARKKHTQYFGDIAKYSKGEEYITERCMDTEAGKDIRVYRMLDYILKKYDENLKHIASLYGRIHSWYLVRNVSDAVFGFLRDSFAYVYLIFLFAKGQITAAEFVFYIGAIASFSAYLESMIRQFMSVNTLISSVGFFREFMETESSWRRDSAVGGDKLERMRKGPVTVELKDVSFRYPGSGNATIKHISLVLKEGEKLALLGLNGAGKTTLVKLICGFYTPTEGEILINGISQKQFTKKEYLSLISVLFQDATLLPRTVDENIAGGKEIDRQWLAKVLELSGFGEKYESLSQKGETMLIKKVEENATDFSGGEKQKLLFARALYKKAPLVILDEPTAALDPIAENELYMHFGQALENRSAIYISHRLSSTRFCDRIVLLERGRVIEEGTHDSLMKLGGRYAELYEMQSRYYREDSLRLKRSQEMGDQYAELQKGGVFNE